MNRFVLPALALLFALPLPAAEPGDRDPAQALRPKLVTETEPIPAAPDVNKLIEDVKAADRALVDAQAKRKAAFDALQAALKELNDRLAALGIKPATPTDPVEPPPETAPIPAPGFRVLIVYESGDKLSAGQQGVIYGKAVRDYLLAHCVKGADGKTAEARIFDKDIDVGSDTPLWQAAMKRPRAALPWIVVSTGKKGFEGPLPADVDSTLKLLKKYGGE